MMLSHLNPKEEYQELVNTYVKGLAPYKSRNFDNHPRLIPVDTSVFTKTENEKARLKQLKKQFKAKTK